MRKKQTKNTAIILVIPLTICDNCKKITNDTPKHNKKQQKKQKQKQKHKTKTN